MGSWALFRKLWPNGVDRVVWHPDSHFRMEAFDYLAASSVAFWWLMMNLSARVVYLNQVQTLGAGSIPWLAGEDIQGLDNAEGHTAPQHPSGLVEGFVGLLPQFNFFLLQPFAPHLLHRCGSLGRSPETSYQHIFSESISWKTWLRTCGYKSFSFHLTDIIHITLQFNFSYPPTTPFRMVFLFFSCAVLDI